MSAAQAPFVTELDECENSMFETMRCIAVGRVSQRAYMVLLLGQGYCIAKIARIFNASEIIIRQWIVRYEAHGVNGSLTDLAVGGRRSFQWPFGTLSSNLFNKILQSLGILSASGALKSCVLK